MLVLGIFWEISVFWLYLVYDCRVFLWDGWAGFGWVGLKGGDVTLCYGIGDRVGIFPSTTIGYDRVRYDKGRSRDVLA